MTSDMHDQQAAAFVAWHRKRGGDWMDNFGAWSRSKDFMPRDEFWIRRAAAEMLTARGVSVLDCLPDTGAA